MHFTATRLADAWLVDIERRQDERGFFARSWCREEFAAHGLAVDLAQCNISVSTHRGTLRGMHFQHAPHDEAKLVRCTASAIWDVIIDLRPGSPTFRQWQGFKLTAESHRSLYVPPGFAHGFQTLGDDAEVIYQMSAAHAPDAADGLRYDDPAFAIAWPIPVTCISARDLAWPDYALPQVAAQFA